MTIQPPPSSEHADGCTGIREHACRECGALTCACGDCDCPVEVPRWQAAIAERVVQINNEERSHLVDWIMADEMRALLAMIPDAEDET